MILTDSGDPTRKILSVDVIPIILRGSTRYDMTNNIVFYHLEIISNTANIICVEFFLQRDVHHANKTYAYKLNTNRSCAANKCNKNAYKRYKVIIILRIIHDIVFRVFARVTGFY